MAFFLIILREVFYCMVYYNWRYYMKIIFFTGSMGKGGAERVLSILSKMYVDLGHEVKIVSVLKDKLSYELAKGVQYESIARPNKSRYLNIYYWIRKINRVVRNDKPDYVISFFSKVSILVILARVHKLSRLFISERNNPSDDYNFLTKILVSILFPKAEKIILQTRTAYDFMPKKVKSKSQIIMNPLFYDIPACTYETNRIVAVGRLATEKNHELLIKSFSSVIDKIPENATLHIYGEGELRQHLQELIHNKGLTKRVILEGTKNAIFSEIKDAKLFVMPSITEGLSNSLLEAMAMGIPIIGSDIPGINSVIIDGINGVLFKSSSDSELSQRIIDAFDDYNKYRNMGLFARNYILKEYVPLVNKKWIQLLDS